nr:hypothetical protein [Enhygromyxa salina]
MRLVVSTPERELELESLVALRFIAEDGWRGVLPGHEPARARLRRGAARCVEAGVGRAEARVRWLATEDGVVLVDRAELRILTRWAALADSLVDLRELVEARDAERTRLEHEARAFTRRHEVATRRALGRLERRVSRP